mmetsp:Transcript_73777/g.123244  ORF Transcript_73777/g.123244 Transcript_73777/m.123244 type:complete len:665 (+) Transcript_73777:52-2046(+)|eukprot:CAMPEP_0119325388 /NCGR_PEP_ID=MMETSP1333-20130426/65662_1 /TAXON_ID=418940 /ORGANISM="Scyphosphaera apsteinii, Strain RCC1455" /LENGTH=664 /DNA_ID=CAMNT_0007333365 /DNA_START=50 /DNA_END=2044 /DNA_ORIENTATION=+
MVLLRVRITSGATIKLRVEPTLTHEEFLRQVAEAAGMPAASCSLSLNKKTPLACPLSSPLSMLDVSNGDLLYLLANTTNAASDAPVSTATSARIPASSSSGPIPAARAVSPLQSTTAAPRPVSAAGAAAAARAEVADSVHQLVQMGFAESAARAALSASHNKLELAVEKLTTSQAESTRREPPATAIAAATAGVTDSLPPANSELPLPITLTMMPGDMRAEIDDGSVPMDVEGPHPPLTSAPTACAPAAVPAAIMQPALLPRMSQRLRSSLTSNIGAYDKVEAHEACVMATHASLVESGFVLAGGPSGSAYVQKPSAGSAEAMKPPPGWRSSTAMYAFNYGHVRQASASAGALLDVKCVLLGRELMIHAMLTAARVPKVVSCQLSLGHSSIAPSVAWLDPVLHKLSRELVQPLLIELGAQLLDPRATGRAIGLQDLCPELTLAVLSHLEARALCRAARCCGAFCSLAADESLWAPLYASDFGNESPSGSAQRAYRSRVEAEHDAEKRRAQNRPRPMPHPLWPDQETEGGWPMPGVPYPGGAPFPGPLHPNFPGLVGGDFDRMPGGLPPPSGPYPFADPYSPMPGLHGGPDGIIPRGSVPPGARFDPISPLVDPDGMSGGPGMGRGPRPVMPGRGGFGGGRFGGGRGGGRGRGWDPDGPDLPGIL